MINLGGYRYKILYYLKPPKVLSSLLLKKFIDISGVALGITQRKHKGYARQPPPFYLCMYTDTRKSPKSLLTNSRLYLWVQYSDNIPRNTLGGSSKNRYGIGVKAPLGVPMNIIHPISNFVNNKICKLCHT